MILEVCAKEVGIDSVGDVGTDQEAVCVRLRYQVGPTFAVRKGFTDAFERTWQKVTVSTLPEQGTYLFIIKAANKLYRARVRVRGLVGSNESFNCSERTQLVIDTSSKDEFFIKATELSWLSIKELQFPIYYRAIYDSSAIDRV